MPTLEDTKVVLRITSNAFDPEVEVLIDAAVADMTRVGVDPDYIDQDGPLVRMAVFSYAKAHFGYDNEEAARFDASYRQIVADMLNSPANIAAKKVSESE